ncbi:MAG: alpha/beta hydrolase [Thermodesulfobacteriota bacterium]
MPYADLEDGRLFYEVSGQGPPVVLLHGAWASHEWWHKQAPDLSRRATVYVPDLRGHGRSSPLARVWSVPGFAKDIRRLLEINGVGPAVLVGWSLGGLVAMQIGLDHPETVAGLVLLATRGHRNPAMKTRVLLHYFRSVLGLLMDLAAPRAFDRTGREFEAQRRAWLAREARRMLSPGAPEELVAWVVADLAERPRANFLLVARSAWNWEAGEALRRLAAPTLILVGEDDRLTPPKYSRLLHELIPGSELVEIPGTGHYAALEKPETVNGEINRFLDGLSW